MKIHFFQRYHSKENVDTANAMLLLSRLYSYSPTKFFAFLREILPENASVELLFDMQKKSESSVPDATITQASFKVVVETKLKNNFSIPQLQGHLRSFSGEDYKVLLTLDPAKMSDVFKQKVKACVAEYNDANQSNAIHRHLTFEELVNGIAEAIDERDYEMQDVLDDYREYCSASGLIPDSWKRMRVRLSGLTLEINKKLGLYYDGMGRNLSRTQYLGLYNQKSVKAIGKVIAVAVIVRNGDTLDIEEEIGIVTDEMKAQVWRAFDEARNYGYSLANEKHRYSFVEQFYDTDFQKTTKSAPRGSRMFDLCEVLECDALPDTEEIAELLRHRKWE